MPQEGVDGGPSPVPGLVSRVAAITKAQNAPPVPPCRRLCGQAGPPGTLPCLRLTAVETPAGLQQYADPYPVSPVPVAEPEAREAPARWLRSAEGGDPGRWRGGRCRGLLADGAT